MAVKEKNAIDGNMPSKRQILRYVGELADASP
jgi:hypothetical protein